MADEKPKRYRVINIGQQPRGINFFGGTQQLERGQSWVGDLSQAEVDGLKAGHAATIRVVEAKPDEPTSRRAGPAEPLAQVLTQEMIDEAEKAQKAAEAPARQSPTAATGGGPVRGSPSNELPTPAPRATLSPPTPEPVVPRAGPPAARR